MQEYNLKRIVRNQKTSKAGKPYESVGIQVAEFGDTWINGFGNKENAHWKEGDKITILIKDNEYNGKISKQFEMPKSGTARSNEEVMKIVSETNVRTLKVLMGVEEVVEWVRKQSGVKRPEYPTAESEGLDPDNLANFDPFK